MSWLRLRKRSTTTLASTTLFYIENYDETEPPAPRAFDKEDEELFRPPLSSILSMVSYCALMERVNWRRALQGGMPRCFVANWKPGE